jgi:hypothetical protein
MVGVSETVKFGMYVFDICSRPCWNKVKWTSWQACWNGCYFWWSCNGAMDHAYELHALREAKRVEDSLGDNEPNTLVRSSLVWPNINTTLAVKDECWIRWELVLWAATLLWMYSRKDQSTYGYVPCARIPDLTTQRPVAKKDHEFDFYFLQYHSHWWESNPQPSCPEADVLPWDHWATKTYGKCCNNRPSIFKTWPCGRHRFITLEPDSVMTAPTFLSSRAILTTVFGCLVSLLVVRSMILWCVTNTGISASIHFHGVHHDLFPLVMSYLGWHHSS